MPDARKHRGPHPEDARLFEEGAWPRLRRATLELSWLLGRGYTPTAALELVGNRHRLDARQRNAVSRCACSDVSLRTRREHRCEMSAPGPLWIDAFNVIVSVESALGGGFLFRGRDGCLRDVASVHGSYRMVEETRPAIELIARTLADAALERCHWLVDSPVSNSGRLAALVREIAAAHGVDWRVEVVPSPDKLLVESERSVASADAWVLDHAASWRNLAGAVIERHVPNAIVVDLDPAEAALGAPPREA